MSHWSSAYIGRPYLEAEFDCGELARLVQREVFGREILIPVERDYMGEAGPVARFRAMARQIAAEAPRLAEPTTLPKDGDAVLLKSRGYFQHIGIYCFVDGEPWVLHASDASMQVVRTRVRELEIRGLRIEGFYRWI